MKGEKLQENLDYSFNWKDLICIDKAFQIYIRDREKLYAELFCSNEDYSKQDVSEYIEFFLSENSSDRDVDAKDSHHHEYLHNIHHFLDREYLYTILPSYSESVNTIKDCLYYYGAIDTVEDMNEFIEFEGETIENLKEFWHDFLDTIADYPLMHLEKMNKTNIMGTLVYYDKKTQPFVLNEVTNFLQDIKNDFPTIMKRFDTLFILDNDYLNFLADDGGEDSGTQAFYTDNSIYIKARCDDLKNESEKFFYKEVLRHEFGHRVFDSLPEYLQVYWEESYKKWKEKNIKMCRAEEKNSQLDVYCQELFADCMACKYFQKTDEIYNDENYIHYPNQQIMDTFMFIIRKGFEE